MVFDGNVFKAYLKASHGQKSVTRAIGYILVNEPCIDFCKYTEQLTLTLVKKIRKQKRNDRT